MDRHPTDHRADQAGQCRGRRGSASSEIALRWAVDEVRRTHRPLHVVHALESEPVHSDKLELGSKEAPAGADPVVTAAMYLVRSLAPEVEAKPHSVIGFAPTTLIAASRVARTVVVGSHGRSATPTALLGSVSQDVAIHSSCPVVVVRENATGTSGQSAGGHVVVGMDGSEASQPALEYAFAQAASTGSRLTAVHTWWWEPLEGISLGEPWIGDWTQIADPGGDTGRRAVGRLVAEVPRCLSSPRRALRWREQVAGVSWRGQASQVGLRE